MFVNRVKLHTLQCILFYLSLSSAQELLRLNTRDSTASTCPYRTINYITHSLPRQCLATSNAVLVSKQEERSSIPVAESETKVDTEDRMPTSGTRPPSADASTIDTTSSRDRAAQSSVPTKPEELGTTSTHTKGAEAPDNVEGESELESGSFLSFEEWKKQNLKKVGQSEHIAHRNQEASQGGRQRHIHNSLESLGDEGEIDIDFSGLVPGGPQYAREVSQPVADHVPDEEGSDSSRSPGALGRSKDAGTTCKERFNYASFDCAANVLKTNKEAKSSHTVLMENKDSYMLNKCAAPSKFLVLELCNDISIDTIVLANFEFFSSTFRTFRVSVSDRYPVELDKWKPLGTYEARNTREIQAFLVENPLIWARYVRIDFLTHYGNEFYCPVSLVRVHGKTMFEDYKNLPMDDDEEDEDNGRDSNPGAELVDSFTPEAVAEILKTKTPESEESTVTSLVTSTTTTEVSSFRSAETTGPLDASSTVPASVVAFEAIMSVIDPSDTCVAADSPSATLAHTGPSPAFPARIPDSSTPAIASPREIVTSSPEPRNMTSSQQVTTSGRSTSAVKMSTTAESGKSTALPVSHSSSSKSSVVSDFANTTSSKTTPSHKDKATASESPRTSSATMQQQKEKPSASTSERAKSGGSPSQAQPATPTMQESFFKSVQKRLQMLEANSSLSLQYIEDQSRALRDAFKKVEQRQLTKTTAFLDQLNQTVLNELRDFRQQYDQLWQSTVIELELQRERYERDNEAINARLGILADEVIFQRRMAILQMVLILVCLILVLFSRGVINNYLELPLVQNVLSKSPSSKWLNLSGVDSPARPPQPPRMRSALQLRNGILKSHRRMQSEDSITDTQSGPEAYAPPTPVSEYGQSEVELFKDESKSPIFESDKDDNRFDDPEFDPNSIERPSTSPPVLRVNGSPLISDILETSEEDMLEKVPNAKSNSIPNSTSPLTLNTEFVPIGKRLSWDLPNSQDHSS